MRSTRTRLNGPVLAPGVVLAVLLGGGLVGCGADDETSSSDPTGMAGMDMSAMDEPGATPADEVEGDVRTGPFALLDTAPPGSEGVRGRAWLAQDDAGTTVTIRLSGLEPGAEYLAHLHAQSCAEDDGGDHFRFDPEGSELPPNEVHLGFTASDDGTGEATVTNDQRVGDDAPAVVVHPAEAMDNRLACADVS